VDKRPDTRATPTPTRPLIKSIIKAGVAAATPPAKRRLKRPVTNAGAIVVISDDA
jgi:hypothetical protein